MKLQTILAIESATGDGSISLWRGGTEELLETSNSNSSRAERIISEIDSLLRNASVSKGELDLIAVSVGPGSYSGIRIGVSTALGLGHSLGVPVVGVSVLEALASGTALQKVIAVVPIGRSDLAWQIFDGDPDGNKRAIAEPSLDPVSTFRDSLKGHHELPVVAPEHCVESLRDIVGVSHGVMGIESSLASTVARLAAQGGRSFSNPRPIYMRSAVARSGT